MKSIRTLLILANHPDVVEQIRVALNSPDDRLIHRTNLQDAEPFLVPGRVDAIILDVENREAEAIWVLERLRRAIPECPTLVLTGAEKWEWEEEAYHHGVDHVLVKPLRPRILKAVVERIVARGVPAMTMPSVPKRVLPRETPAAETSRLPVQTLQVLRDFSAVLTHSLCAEAMLKQFLLLLRGIVGVNRAAIFLRAPASASEAGPARRFRNACAIGLPAGVLEDFELSYSTGLGGFLHQHGRILRRDSDEAAQNPQIQKEFDLLGAQVAVPILDRESLVGIATFDGRLTGEPLGNAELELIFHLLEQLGLAVRNIWLHDQLSANHEMMADILRHLSSACVVVGRELGILHFNKTARQLFGRSGQIGLQFTDLPQLLGGKVFQVLKNGTAIAPFKYEPEDSPGTVHRVSILPFKRMESPVPDSVLLVVEDLTQSEQLQKLEIETANLRLIKSMADRIAHEVGNAMVPLSTHQQLLAERYKDSEFRASLNVAMAEGVKRVDRLINQMRFLARDTVASEEPLELARLIEDSFRDAQRHLTVKSPKLLIEADGPAIVINGDRAALRHAFAELLLNALQANPADALVTVNIHADSAPLGNGDGRGKQARANGVAPTARPALAVEIVDNGNGFTAEALKVAPKPFFTTRNIGLGLGMSVSKKIIECHGGSLTIADSSGPRHGMVRVSFPAERLRSELEAPSRSQMHSQVLQ